MFTKVMDAGCGFGELALLYNDKRSATIKAVEECEVYSLDGNLFKGIVMKASMDKRDTRQRFLN
jgi:cGMP-dependent protein kinase 2